LIQPLNQHIQKDSLVCYASFGDNCVEDSALNMLSPLRSIFSSPSLSVQSDDPSKFVSSPEIAQIFRAAFAGSEHASPSPSCRDRHKITPHLRAHIMSWLNEVSQLFQLQQETLFMAWSILSLRSLPLSLLQLVCCWLSSQYPTPQPIGALAPAPAPFTCNCSLPLSFLLNSQP
jgi:hypothetical protein